MKKKGYNTIQLVGVLLVIFFFTGCAPTKNDIYFEISDNDTLNFESSGAGLFGGNITGKIYKAINSRYIANQYGFTTEKRKYGESIRKSFHLIDFDYCAIPDDDAPRFFTSLNAAKSWDYYINDEMMIYDSRVLVSALELQAIESVEYVAQDTMRVVFTSPMKDAIDTLVGAIYIQTRDIKQHEVNDKSTLYLLNDIVITRKIYDALNPIFIRSLKRIRDKAELERFGNNIKEIVKIDLFEFDDVVEDVIFIGDPKEIYLIDNIPLERNHYFMLNRSCVKEIIEEDSEKEHKTTVVL